MRAFKKSGFSYKKHQQGIALLIALVLTIVFVLIGFIMSERSKLNTSIVGSKVRYDVVYEAGEQSIRDAMAFIKSIRAGEPMASSDGSRGREIVANFPLTVGAAESEAFVSAPSYSFVWENGALENKVCGVGGCPAGINFVDKMDSDIWRTLAIPSTPSSQNSDVDKNNYIVNTRTYTFIQLIKRGKSTGGGGLSGELSGGSRFSSYYLITVKASGYVPGVKKTDDNSRENVILQAVLIQKT